MAEICRRAGISQATYFNWKKKYAGMLPPEMKKLKQLEDENARLKKIVADLTLDREMCRTSFAESSKASQAGGGEGHVPRLGDLDPACLWGAEFRVQATTTPLAVPIGPAWNVVFARSAKPK